MFQNHATISEIRRTLIRELQRSCSVNESSSIARLILEHVGYPSQDYLLEPNKVPETAIKAQITEIVSEIHRGKPIQYILGYTYFCDLKIQVNESVLIPRPETEEMVYHISSVLSPPVKRILDLGTGSGCLALALKHSFPEADVTGFDISTEALKVSRSNGALNHLDVNWIQGDMLQDSPLESELTFDLVISNPPYVLKSESEMMTKNVLDHEPGSALFVNDSDPLIYFRSIASFCKDRLESGGRFWVEINERFGLETARLFKELGFEDVAIIKDIHGKDRFVNGSL